MFWLITASATAVSLAVAWLTLPEAIRLAQRHELLDLPGRHKRHHRPVPNIGGAVLFVSLWSAVGFCLLIFPELLAELASSIVFIFCGALIIFLVGFSDDLAPVSAVTKILAQVSAGVVLFLGGLAINPVSVPFLGSHDIGQASILITIVWVVLLTNAVNLIDGLDGLAGGVSLIAALTMAVIGTLFSALPAVLFAYALVGFLAVFLVFNRYPARVFLGDSGALQIGYYFAVISLLVPIKSFTAAALYLPLLALGVPLLETLASVFRRLASRRNVLKADRRHLFHYLAMAGLSPRAIVTVFYLLSAFFGLFALAMFFWNRLVVFGFLLLFMVVIFGLFFIFLTGFSRASSERSGRSGSENKSA